MVRVAIHRGIARPARTRSAAVPSLTLRAASQPTTRKTVYSRPRRTRFSDTADGLPDIGAAAQTSPQSAHHVDRAGNRSTRARRLLKRPIHVGERFDGI